MSHHPRPTDGRSSAEIRREKNKCFSFRTCLETTHSHRRHWPFLMTARERLLSPLSLSFLVSTVREKARHWTSKKSFGLSPNMFALPQEGTAGEEAMHAMRTEGHSCIFCGFCFNWREKTLQQLQNKLVDIFLHFDKLRSCSASSVGEPSRNLRNYHTGKISV